MGLQHDEIIPAYERDARCRRLDAQVVEVGLEEGRPYAVTSDTLFYPEGGGQPCDRGAMGSAWVLDVQKQQGRILHYLDRPVEKGPCLLKLDWERRFDHMQQHTAQHLLSALAEREFGWKTTSFHLGARNSDIELDVSEISGAHIGKLEDEVAAEIRAARPVSARRVSREELEHLSIRTRRLPADHRGDIRLVEIREVDITTCGGTHLSSTAEVESLVLTSTASMRGGTRLHFLAGRRVRRRLSAQEKCLEALKKLLSVPEEDVVGEVSNRSRQLALAVRREKELLKDLAQATARALTSSADPLVEAHFPGREMGFLQGVARALSSGEAARMAFLTADSASGSVFLISAGKGLGLDVAALGRRAAELLEGRGGGSGGLFQGKAPDLSARSRVVDYLEQALNERSGCSD